MDNSQLMKPLIKNHNEFIGNLIHRTKNHTRLQLKKVSQYHMFITSHNRAQQWTDEGISTYISTHFRSVSATGWRDLEFLELREELQDQPMF